MCIRHSQLSQPIQPAAFILNACFFIKPVYYVVCDVLHVQGAVGVLELATSTLTMFSGRPSSAQSLADAGAVPVIIKLLSPLFPTVRLLAFIYPTRQGAWLIFKGRGTCGQPRPTPAANYRQ